MSLVDLSLKIASLLHMGCVGVLIIATAIAVLLPLCIFFMGAAAVIGAF